MFKNFVKRAIAIPLVVVVVVVALVVAFSFAAPKLGGESEQPDYSNEFETFSFDSFKELKTGCFVGELEIKDKEFIAPVTYSESISNALVMLKESKEPWKGGSLYVTGNSTQSQLAVLNELKVGDTVYFDMYSKEKTEYKITDINSCMTLDELLESGGENSLVLCRAYNDFSNLSNSYLYAVYTAERV